MSHICNKAGTDPGCKTCPHGRPHDPTGYEGVGTCASISGITCAGVGGVQCKPVEEETMTQYATVTAGGTKTVTEEPLFPTNPTTYTPPEIDMIPVESSNIISVGHDGKETLRVAFKSGSYDYVGIAEAEFFDLVNAPSVGKAYNELTRGKGVKGIKL